MFKCHPFNLYESCTQYTLCIQMCCFSFCSCPVFRQPVPVLAYLIAASSYSKPVAEILTQCRNNCAKCPNFRYFYDSTVTVICTTLPARGISDCNRLHLGLQDASQFSPNFNVDWITSVCACTSDCDHSTRMSFTCTRNSYSCQCDKSCQWGLKLKSTNQSLSKYIHTHLTLA